MARKKSAKKASTKKARSRGPMKKGRAAAKSPMEGTPVRTGKGPGPAEIGRDLVDMFNRGLWREVEDKWWSPAIVSVEGMGIEWRGLKAVRGKNAQWMADHEVHSAGAEGPYVGASGFAVKFNIDVTTKSTGRRDPMVEVGVYTIRNGKIVREEFMYGQ